MNYLPTMYIFYLSLLATGNSLYAESWLNKIKNTFKKDVVEIEQRSLPFAANERLVIHNPHGNIYIKTAWNQNAIFMTAQKHANTLEQLPKIQIKETRRHGELHLETVIDTSTKKASVDYILIIPETACINLKTETGSIKIKKTCGPITAQTTTGNITIYSAEKTVQAQVQEKGNITIHNAYEAVEAQTCKGNITLNNTHASIAASTNHGTIHVQATKIPSTASIDLSTHSGNIELQTPKNIHADIKACAAHGSVHSNHPITIKPFTTKLDPQAWKRFKQQIDGTIGTGEATIALSTDRGAIRLMRDTA